MMSASVGLKRELDMAKAEGGIFEKEKVKKSKSDSDELEAAQAELAELKKQLEAEKKKASQSKTKEQGDEKNFELSKKRRVTVKLFNGTKLLVDIREFYEKNGEMLPVSLIFNIEIVLLILLTVFVFDMLFRDEKVFLSPKSSGKGLETNSTKSMLQ
mmetsp:Transcript_14404/g.16478  ORF Transcript_14404/g.16478 Transcript_14404/m.16478 type:complete len:157 (-) Transcript_14404:550-1020(-)